MSKLKEHAGVGALIVSVLTLCVALTGIAGALPSQNGTPRLNVTQRTATFGPIASGAAGDGVAKCAKGEVATGGGFTASSGFGRIDGSRPELNSKGKPVGWHVFVGNDSPGSATFQVQVLCTPK